MSVVITAGQRGDSPQFEPVLEKVRVPRIGPGRPRTRPNRVRADKAYASRKNRAYLRRRGIRSTIPTKTDQARNRKKLGSKGGRPPKFDPEDYKAGTPSSAASIASKDTAPWPQDTTSSRSATRRPSSSRPSTRGCNQTAQDGKHTSQIVVIHRGCRYRPRTCRGIERHAQPNRSEQRQVGSTVSDSSA